MAMTQRRFDRQIAVVTGAASGIGAATARALAEEGAGVYLADVDLVGAEREAERAIASGGACWPVRCDVTSEADVARLIQDAIERHGHLDVLHANAGIEWTRTISDTDLSDWRRVIEVNLTGVYLVCRQALKQMIRQRRGSIVITSSPHAVTTVPDAGAYAASKGGLLSLTKALALEGAGYGVRANAILPGAIDTPMVRREAQVADDPEAQMATFGMCQPLGRLGLPHEVAAAVLFLASDAASFVTGAELAVDGGMLAALPSGPPLSYRSTEIDKTSTWAHGSRS